MPPQPMMPQMQSSVPSMPAPPSSIMMSEERAHSELLKANFARRMELLELMRRLIRAKEKEAKIKKNMKATDEALVPGHPIGVKPTDDEDPDGQLRILKLMLSCLVLTLLTSYHAGGIWDESKGHQAGVLAYLQDGPVYLPETHQ